MTDRPDRATSPQPADRDEELAPASASPGDSGREAQPDGADAVAKGADRVDRLERHNRPMDDDSGINPGQTQSATGTPENERDPAPDDARS